MGKPAILHIQIPEHPSDVENAGRLGRNVLHDPLSKYYPYEPAGSTVLRSVRHKRLIPVLDQGNIGACTGNAEEGLLGTEPFFAVIPESHPRKPTGDADDDEAQAVQLYSEATRLDPFSGAYPPIDTGSNGLSVCKAAKAAGLISGYLHAFSLTAALQALTTQPVITGINWYDSFDEPDHNGLIRITNQASVRGGHEMVLDEILVTERLIGGTNSWGTGWGKRGRFYISWADFERLMHEHGDVTIPVPLDQPAPKPVADINAPGCLSKLGKWFS